MGSSCSVEAGLDPAKDRCQAAAWTTRLGPERTQKIQNFPCFLEMRHAAVYVYTSALFL